LRERERLAAAGPAAEGGGAADGVPKGAAALGGVGRSTEPEQARGRAAPAEFTRHGHTADELANAGVQALAEARDELAQAKQLRSEAARAADEALNLRRRLFLEEQAAAQRLQRGRQEQAALLVDEQEALAQERRQMVEERREMVEEKREIALELARARDVRASAQRQWEAVHTAAKEARLAATSAVEACDAATEKRLELEEAMAVAENDFAVQRREDEAMMERDNASWDLVRSLQHEAAERGREVTAAEREVCKIRVLLHEESQSFSEMRSEHDRLVRELRDLSRLSRWATRVRMPGA